MLRYGWLFILVCLSDWLSKEAITRVLTLGEGRLLLPKLLAFHHVSNTGVAFSAFAQWPGWIVSVVTGTLLALVATVWVLELKRQSIQSPASTLNKTALTVLVAGGFANWVDRLIDGRVVDFIEVLFIDFPVFNVADIAVSCGAVLMALSLLLSLNDEHSTPHCLIPHE